jgi:hypothetical protein
MAMNPAALNQHDVPIGRPIYSADGQLLGRSDGVDSGYVRVAAHAGPNFWLPLHAIQAEESDRLVMVFPLEQLPTYREDVPPP